MAIYRERVLRDLVEWRKAGWVSPEGASAIAASLPAKRKSLGFAAVIGMLGAVLVGAGIIALVAANWEAIPRLVRLVGALATMGLAYLAAWLLRGREHPGFSEAALLIAGAAFAGAVALVGQTYNLGNDFSALIAIWAAGVLGSGFLLSSTVMTVLGLIGGAVWTYNLVTEVDLTGPHWLGLLPSFCLAIYRLACSIRLSATLLRQFRCGDSWPSGFSPCNSLRSGQSGFNRPFGNPAQTKILGGGGAIGDETRKKVW